MASGFANSASHVQGDQGAVTGSCRFAGVQKDRGQAPFPLLRYGKEHGLHAKRSGLEEMRQAQAGLWKASAHLWGGGCHPWLVSSKDPH